MTTVYNPEGREDNCGFCAISYGLHLQNGGKVTNADELYLLTIEHLGLTRNGNQDPVPRLLIFPDHTLPQGVPSTAYSALSGVLSLSSYTITSVAQQLGLRFGYSRQAVQLPNQFLAFRAEKGSRGRLNDFMKVRLDLLRSNGRNPSADAVRKQVSDELIGHSIIGSQDARHFINAHIDPEGNITGCDAQNGARFEANGIRERMRSIALFMHLQ
jgi:hypothetical protein